MIHYKISDTLEDVSQAWDNLVKHDFLLHSNYIKALEQASPNNIQLYYLEVFKRDELVGVALIQRVQLYLKDMFRQQQMSCFKEVFRNIISKVLRGNILVIGNLTHTGQHAVYFDESKIIASEFYEEVFKAVSDLQKIIKSKSGKTIRAVMIKDFFLNDGMINKESFDNEKLHKVKVQPNMIMTVRSHWNSNQDYVSDLNKKYRDRFKRAKKKLNSIVPKEMDLEAIKANTELLYKLYLNVSNNAKFNTFILPENHFYVYKGHLKENFKVIGYYLKDQLVGFYTLILNNQNLETYFLGYDEEHQYPNQLYLNMLYDMAKFGIENKFERIIYARTAMEIKSSVGAKAEPMIMYLKHTNPMLNAILKRVFKLMNPTQDWQERHPFK